MDCDLLQSSNPARGKNVIQFLKLRAMQYYVTSAPVRDEVVALIRTAESFNAELLDVIDRLTNEKIEKFRKKFISLI